MPVVAKNIIPSKSIDNTQTTQYVAANVTTIIDKFTATNFSGSAVSININLASVGEATGNANLIVKSRMLQAGETYTFPEIVGHILGPGGFISTSATASAAVNIRASGREIS